MPVTKIEQYTTAENKIAKIGRGISHPARLRIIDLINQNGFVKNCQLIKELNLTKTSVANHIQKLKEAELIQIDYEPNFLKITLNQKYSDKLKDLLDTSD